MRSAIAGAAVAALTLTVVLVHDVIVDEGRLDLDAGDFVAIGALLATGAACGAAGGRVVS